MGEPLAFLEIEGKLLYRDMMGILEKEFQKWVEAWARANGWLAFHCPPPMRGRPHPDPGFPDLVLVRSPRLLFVELKRQDRSATLSLRQKTWIEALTQCGAETKLWRPSDIPEILELLRMPS